MKKTQITVLKRIIKPAGRADLAGIFYDDSGRACACDGFRAIRTHERPEGLPTVAGINLEEFYKRFEQGARLVLPSVKELTEIIKASRARGEKFAIYDFGEGSPMVNAQYLLDIIRLFPGAIAFENLTKKTTSAIFFEDITGDALLLPIVKKA